MTAASAPPAAPPSGAIPLRRPLAACDREAIHHAWGLLAAAEDRILSREPGDADRCVIEAMRVLARLQASRERPR